MVEMEQAIRDRVADMQDGDEMEISYTVDVIRNGIAVTGEGGERLYTKDEAVQFLARRGNRLGGAAAKE